MKKNIFDKIQDKFSTKLEDIEKREDFNALKKIPFWLIVFFPYALYLILFKTKINKFVKFIVLSIFIFISILFADISLNPNRVYNDVGLTSYNLFVEENKDLKLDKAKYVNKNNHFKIDDQMYFSFSIYDSLNMYYGLFEINDYNKDYRLVSLYDTDYNFSNIYATDDFKNVKEIHPIVLNFILSNNVSNIRLENISKLSDVEEIDLFENITRQEVKINNKTYDFEFNDFNVTSIKYEGELIYESSNHNILKSNTSSSVLELLNKNFDSNYELVGYNYINSEHYYNLTVGSSMYCIRHYPGKDIELLSILDKDTFLESISDLMIK